MHLLVNSTAMCGDSWYGLLDCKAWYFYDFLSFFFPSLETTWKKLIPEGLHPIRGHLSGLHITTFACKCVTYTY